MQVRIPGFGPGLTVEQVSDLPQLTQIAARASVRGLEATDSVMLQI